MATKIKDFTDCRSGREIEQVAKNMEDDGVKVREKGSYVEIEYNGHFVYAPDSDRAMPKSSRQLILTALKAIGLATLLLAILAANGVL